MMFCPKCGSLLKTKQVKEKSVHFCGCGYTSAIKKETTIKEEIVQKDDKIEVHEDITNILPLTAAACPKCKHNKAYYWLRQTRAGDEPETKFLKCEKCKHTWRDYS